MSRAGLDDESGPEEIPRPCHSRAPASLPVLDTKGRLLFPNLQRQAPLVFSSGYRERCHTRPGCPSRSQVEEHLPIQFFLWSNIQPGPVPPSQSPTPAHVHYELLDLVC